MHNACLFLLALATNIGQAADKLSVIIEDHQQTPQSPLEDHQQTEPNYCSSNTLDSGQYVNMEKADSCGATTEDSGVCEVEATNEGEDCSVAKLTCRKGVFHPPRATCQKNQCDDEGWSSDDNGDSFGKIAELSDAQSYLYMDKNERKVKLTVYVNKRWFKDEGEFATIDIYLINTNDDSDPKWKSAWKSSEEDEDLKDEIPAYFKKDGNPCVVALQLDVGWEEWINELDTSKLSYPGDDNMDVNMNQIIVKIGTEKEYVHWDPRLPTSFDSTSPELKQVIEKKLNVIIKYPHVVTAQTPSFTLTDEDHVDVQITSLEIKDVEWGKANKTTFTIKMTMESQVQAPFKMKNISQIPEDVKDMTLSGRGLKREEDCNVAKDGDVFKSDNGRFFQLTAGDEVIQICSQKWSMEQQVTLTDTCEIPIDFGFKWDMACVSDLYECPGGDARPFEISLAELVSAPDVLWICPHMISEHPVRTTFMTYRLPAGEPNRRKQDEFVANEKVYADISLKTAWGFLQILSAEIQNLKIVYDRKVSAEKWGKDGDKKCGKGTEVMIGDTHKCEYVLKKEGSTAALAKDVAFTENDGRSVLVYQYSQQGREPNESGCYDDAGEVFEHSMEDCKGKGMHWGHLFNRHHYALGFNFKITEDVFPTPYADCDASTWTKEDGLQGKRDPELSDGYQKQVYLGGEFGASLNEGSKNCEFEKGRMVFLAEVEVTYIDGNRRRVLMEHTPAVHNKGIQTRTAIVVESEKEAQYEEALNVEALRQFANFSAKKEPIQQQVLAQEEDTPAQPPDNSWEIPTGGIVAVAAILVLLMLLCFLHYREKQGDKLFDESMDSLLKRYPRDSERPHVRIVEKKNLETVREREKLDDNDIEDNVLGRSMMVPVTLQPAPTAIAAFGEDAPDPDDLPPVPVHRRGGHHDNESLPRTQRASSTAPNSTRGTILHAVHSVQSGHSGRPPSYRHPSVQSVTSCRSLASNTTQDPRTPHEESCHSSATIRSTSRITSKRGTEERATMTMSTCTDYVIDRGPDAPV